MAIVRFTGFESGQAVEAGTITGTGSIVSTGQRTGSYGFRANPTTTGTGFIVITPLLATGLVDTTSSFADGSAFGFAFKAVTLPSGNEELIAESRTSAGVTQWSLTITSTGVLKLYQGRAGSLLATGTTVIGSTYVYIEVSMNNTSNAYNVRINGVSEISGTNASINIVTGQLTLGKMFNINGRTVDFYYDDVYVDTAGTFRGKVQVKRLVPNAAGTNSAWTAGTGAKTFAEVDEVPPESDGTDASYIEAAATDDNKATTFRVQSTTTGGIGGASILAVEGYVWAKTGSVSGTSTVSLRVNVGASNSDSTGMELLTSYQGVHRVLTTNPATSAAWTNAGVDTVEVGMTAATIAQTQRFSAAYIFVLYNESPTVVLNNPLDASSSTDDTPTLNFTGTDGDGDTIEYNVQIDPANTFDSGITSLISDNFDDNSLNGSLWSANISGGGITMTETGSRFETVIPTQTVANAGRLASVNAYNLTGATVTVNTIQNPSTGTNCQSALFLDIDASNWFRWIKQGGTLYAQYMKAGSQNTAGSVSFSQVTHKWWRVRESGGVIHWETSTDGVSWTDQFQFTHGMTITAVKIRIEAETFQAETSPGSFIFDDFSFTTPGPYLNKLSTVDSGFTAGHPFVSGVAKDFTVQAGDTLPLGTYYWRVRAIDPLGSNIYGDYATTRSFSVISSTFIKTINGLANASVKSINGLVKASIKSFNGLT